MKKYGDWNENRTSLNMELSIEKEKWETYQTRKILLIKFGWKEIRATEWKEGAKTRRVEAKKKW